MPEKAKLVILSAFYEPYMSGAEQMAKEIAERLGDAYDITLITGRFDRDNPVREERPGFRLERVGVGHKQLDKLFYPLLAALKARALKPEIVHAIMESYAGIALVLAKYSCPRAKRILTLQSGDLDDERKQKKLWVKLFFRKIHTTPHKVTAISSFLADRARRLGVPEDRIAITPNGLDFSKVPESVAREQARVICVGRLSWEKGHKYLLEAWPEVLERFREAKLILVGEGSERANIEKLIQEKELSQSVVLAGNLPHDQVLDKLAESEVFVCPSLAEGLGNVFIEAQACGTPPIGTRVGGIPDVVTDGLNGLLVEPREPGQISQAIIRLLEDSRLRERLRQEGIESSRKFAWQSIIAKIGNIYEELLKTSRK
jgi:glycosyltransferase involved in cell wall biosynthesis